VFHNSWYVKGEVLVGAVVVAAGDDILMRLKEVVRRRCDRCDVVVVRRWWASAIRLWLWTQARV